MSFLSKKINKISNALKQKSIYRIENFDFPVDKFLTSSANIKVWLQRHGITKFDLLKNDKYGWVVDVYQSVDLSYRGLLFIPVKFNEIEGKLDVSHNNLLSLEFCPQQVQGSFNMSVNLVKDLKGGPETVHGSFIANLNQLNTLEYFPSKVHGIMSLQDNPELGGAQKIVGFKELQKVHEIYLEKSALIGAINEISPSDQKIDKLKLQKI